MLDACEFLNILKVFVPRAKPVDRCLLGSRRTPDVWENHSFFHREVEWRTTASWGKSSVQGLAQAEGEVYQ
jgi:hypothetical protein